MLYCSTVKDYPCSVDYFFMTIPGLCLMMNSYGIIQILCFTKEMTFETYVLFCGVLEGVAFYLYRLLQRDYFFFCQEFLQETIALVIIYKFSRIILEVKGKVYGQLTLGLFLSTMTFCLFLFVIILYNDLYPFLSIEHSDIIKTTKSSFYFIIALSLVVFGIYLKNIIRYSLVELYIDEGVDLCLEDPNSFNQNKEDQQKGRLSSEVLHSFDRREIYYSTRITQLNIVIYSDFTTDLIQLICTVLQHYFFAKDFEQVGLSEMPKTIIACVILVLDEICSLIVTISYFFAFYFILRNAFTNQRNTVGEVIRDSDFCFSLQHEQTDVKNYLSFERSILQESNEHDSKDKDNKDVNTSNINSHHLEFSGDLE